MTSDRRDVSRRGALAGAAALLCGGAARAPAGMDALTVYSPAPPDNPLHALNLELAAAACRRGVTMTMTPLALPASINSLATMSSAERGRHLPIVAATDLQAALAGGGPAWHAYVRRNDDLRFVSKLYDVGFGIATADATIRSPDDLRGKRIGVPARPSAVRWMTEALLGPGWGVLDQVRLVELGAASVPAALAAGEIDATSWNLVLPGRNGYQRAFQESRALRHAAFLAVDQPTLRRVNAGGGFTLGLLQLLPDQPPLLGFSQALAAWKSTPASNVSALHEIVRESCGRPGMPRDPHDMLAWPGLTTGMIHQAVRGRDV